MSKRIVITGGPSAGKTTLLQLLASEYGRRVNIAPEAASILFRGGLPRPITLEDRIHTQRSIYALQRELEAQALEKNPEAPLFCDRGSLDGNAYWHSANIKEFCFAMGSSLDRELSRYHAVIHLETALEGKGYTINDVRNESPQEARRLDMKIGETWSLHHNYCFIANGVSFLEKLQTALNILNPYLPEKKSLDHSMLNQLK